jgi:ribosomal protein S25
MPITLIAPDGTRIPAKPSIMDVDRITRNRKLLDELKGECLTIYQLEKRVKIHSRVIRRIFNQLAEEGIVKKKLVKKGNFYVAYFEVIDGN